MCSTCGCGKKADTFEAPKRQRIGNRFISRRKDGTISKNVDVGRSLSADRRRKAKTTASAGQGDKGDLKRAESKFDKLSNEIAKDYEKKGKSKDEAEEIGKATAYKIGVAKYGKRGMERKARAGRAKNAESFGAEDVIDRYDIDMYSLMTLMAFQDPTDLSVVKQSINEMSCDRDTVRWAINWWEETWGGVPEETLNYLGLNYDEEFGADEKKRSGMKIAPKIKMVNYEDVMTEKMKNRNMKDAESFGSESGGAGHLVCTECKTSHDIRDTDGWLIYGVGVGEEVLCPECGNGEGAGYLVCTIEGCYNSSDINTDGWYIGSLGQNAKVYCPTHGRGEYPEYYDDDYNAETFGADGFEMAYVKRPHHVAYVRKKWLERPMDKGFEYPNMHTDQNKQGKIWDDRTGFRKMDSKERGLFEEIGGKISDFDVVGTTQDVVGKTGFTTVQRPHHVARVRNKNIHGTINMDGKNLGLEQWNKPNNHTEANKKGMMYDEERGWVKMDDKARTMFEELGYKISDFNVVGTTQDVVGKTGFNIPTGVASIAVVFMAYMTGKKYGN